MVIRALVFDLFDTLVDLDVETVPKVEFAGRTVPRMVSEMHALVREHREIVPDDFLALMREIDRELRATHFARDLEVPSDLRFGTLVTRLGIESPELTGILVETHMRGLRRQVRSLDHHPSVLADLRRGVRVGICSNFSHSPTALRVLAESGLSEHLDAIVISDEMGVRKPRPEIFEATLEALDVTPEETLHVGDNLQADVRGAAAVGIRTVWITRRVADPVQALVGFDGPRPDWQIADLAELPELVERVSSRS